MLKQTLNYELRDHSKIKYIMQRWGGVWLGVTPRHKPKGIELFRRGWKIQKNGVT